MKERAYAKINLSLDVISKREDGYHELNMIMVPLDFYDLISIEISDEMSMESNAGYLPKTEKNTIIKAIEVMREEYGFTENFKIVVQKHIPTQAGLAGGSADAAAAIRIVKRLLKIDIPKKKMLELAKKVGADVPFCCLNKPSVVSGIGEKIEVFDAITDFHVLLVKPYKGVSTKMAFKMLDFNNVEHPNCKNMKDALVTGDYEKVIASLGNTLEQPSMQLVPEIAKIKAKLLELGMDGVLMSGSGSTVFGLTQSEECLNHAAIEMKKIASFVRKTKILTKK